MQASSLVFVAIVVGWAAYLMPQWVRRREALSQSRGHDRHSAGLRVLSRRPRTAGGPSTTPLLPEPRAVGDEIVDPLADPRSEAPAADLPHRPAVHLPSAAAVAARRRARVLSLLLTATAATWGLALLAPAAGVLAWTATTLLALDLLALVVTGRRRAVRRRVLERDRHRRVEQARRDAVRRSERVDAAPSVPVAAPDAERAVTTAPGPVTAPVPVVERASERVSRELDEGTPGDVWTPVPVPPPTYTLKETAPRPEPAPLDLPGPPPTPTEPAAADPAAAAPASAPQARPQRPWEEDRTFADELDLDEVLARRRAVNG